MEEKKKKEETLVHRGQRTHLITIAGSLDQIALMQFSHRPTRIAKMISGQDFLYC